MKAGPRCSNRESTQSGLSGIGEVFSLILCYLCILFFHLTGLAYILWSLAMCFHGISGCAKMCLSEPIRGFCAFSLSLFSVFSYSALFLFTLSYFTFIRYLLVF